MPSGGTQRPIWGAVVLFLSLFAACPTHSEVPTEETVAPSPPDPLPPSPFDVPRQIPWQPVPGLHAHPLADFRSVDWAARIDSTWGSSPLSVAEMLSLFEAFWEAADSRFACFQDLDVDWDALHDRYQGEIADSVSRGRFAAIMNHLSIALQESHTSAYDAVVNQSTPLLPGVPLLVGAIYGDNGHFGAGLTPLPDSTLLVYSAVSPHPLDLRPGDRVLGYDGVPWVELYPQLLGLELPLTWGRFGSSPSSIRHCWMKSAGMNWHLFETIDVIKYASEDTLHISLEPLVGQSMSLFCSEQLDVPGVPKPDLANNDNVSWGVIEGTDIGYIYLCKLRNDFQQQFYDAVDSLMTYFDTSGLILDFRLNYGGTLDYYLPAFELLFNETVYTLAFGSRCNPSDHEPICPAYQYGPERLAIHGDPETFYDRAIAVLTGPGAVSAGDIGPMMLRFHPEVRVFGLPSCGAFNLPFSIDPAPPAPWSVRYAQYEGYPVSDPSHHLTHDEFPIDEEVWLTPDDVARGVDTVVEAAVAWIRGATAIGWMDGQPARSPAATVSILPVRPNPFTTRTAIRYRLFGPSAVELGIYSASGRLVRVTGGPEALPAGEHEFVWDGREASGEPAGSGLYWARVRTNRSVAAAKLVLIR